MRAPAVHPSSTPRCSRTAWYRSRSRRRDRPSSGADDGSLAVGACWSPPSRAILLPARTSPRAAPSQSRLSFACAPRSNRSYLILLDLGRADDVAILRALGIETARELLRTREFDLYEGRLQSLAHAVVHGGRLQLLREPGDDGGRRARGRHHAPPRQHGGGGMAELGDARHVGK